MAHQVEVLDLLLDLNRADGRTIVIVLHDLNQACRYAHHLVAMREGRIVAEGTPAEIVTVALVSQVFGLEVRILPVATAAWPAVPACPARPRPDRVPGPSRCSGDVMDGRGEGPFPVREGLRIGDHVSSPEEREGPRNRDLTPR
jgi:hypothetical protein